MIPLRIRGQRRKQRKQNLYKKQNWFVTPPKSVLKKCIGWKIGSLSQKLGYFQDFDYKNGKSKVLKQMQEEFQWKAKQYFTRFSKGGQQVMTTKVLKNKDKRLMNLQFGKTFKKKSILKVFDKIENKLKVNDKLQAFQCIRQFAY